MSKWIRWPGFLAFVAIFSGLFVFFYFFAGVMVKNSIEKYGSEAVGAQVNVESVNMTLDPLGFRVGRLQVSNPDEPMSNAVDIQSMAMELAFWNLFMGQVIVNEMSVDGVRFNTARTSSGAIKKKEQPKQKKDSKVSEVLKQAKEELPSAKEILAKETLLVEVKSDELNSLYEQRMAEINAINADLPNEQKLKAYEAEIKELTSGKLKSLEDFQQRKTRLSEINNELKQERQKISEAKQAYRSSYKELNEKLKEVKAAPSQDLKNLKSKYSLDAGGATNVSRLLFGNEAGEWTETTLSWYEKAKPYLESGEAEEVQKVARQEGRYVHFGGIEQLPEFLLREARIDIVIPAGHLDGKLVDLTHQPEVLARPALLTVNGNDLKGYDSINLKAEFNHIDPANSFDRADFKVNAMHISDFRVASDSSFKLKLAKASADIEGSAVIRKGSLDLDVFTRFNDAQFKSEASSGAGRQIGQLLEGIDNFTVTVKVDGKLNNLDTSFDSSLDEQMKAAVNAKIDAKQAELEAELKQKLQARVAEKTGKYNDDLQSLLTGEQSMDAMEQEVENMAKAKLNTWQDQQKAELEAKKAEEKQKAKNKAEEAVRDKLKDFGF